VISTTHRRAEVSKGVVSYHFAAKDDLIFAVAAHVFDSVTESPKAA
jgi:AcrR family transcriptional regulator